eukprot:gnl/Trimastix_PCT/1242.p1 GENE.gnl/Trimastix_PCT/1242~~gnl/Trimastix_PCT/1242.p1  ORF type:complete len:724 (-),score=134.72 gnl/Trimastix_PCT/1242:204-2342(-)
MSKKEAPDPRETQSYIDTLPSLSSPMGLPSPTILSPTFAPHSPQGSPEASPSSTPAQFPVPLVPYLQPPFLPDSPNTEISFAPYLNIFAMPHTRMAPPDPPEPFPSQGIQRERKKRWAPTENQKAKLTSAFRKAEGRITQEYMYRLALHLGTTKDRVRNWFANHRHWLKAVLTGETAPPKTEPSSPPPSPTPPEEKLARHHEPPPPPAPLGTLASDLNLERPYADLSSESEPPVLLEQTDVLAPMSLPNLSTPRSTFPSPRTPLSESAAMEPATSTSFISAFLRTPTASPRSGVGMMSASAREMERKLESPRSFFRPTGARSLRSSPTSPFSRVIPGTTSFRANTNPTGTSTGTGTPTHSAPPTPAASRSASPVDAQLDVEPEPEARDARSEGIASAVTQQAHTDTDTDTGTDTGTDTNTDTNTDSPPQDTSTDTDMDTADALPDTVLDCSARTISTVDDPDIPHLPSPPPSPSRARATMHDATTQHTVTQHSNATQCPRAQLVEQGTATATSACDPLLREVVDRGVQVGAIAAAQTPSGQPPCGETAGLMEQSVQDPMAQSWSLLDTFELIDRSDLAQDDTARLPPSDSPNAPCNPFLYAAPSPSPSSSSPAATPSPASPAPRPYFRFIRTAWNVMSFRRGTPASSPLQAETPTPTPSVSTAVPAAAPTQEPAVPTPLPVPSLEPRASPLGSAAPPLEERSEELAVLLQSS